jgi:predicted dehydrogenase
MRSSSTSSRLRVGLLGAGFIAEAHAAALSRLSGVELASVCDRSRARARRFGTAGVFTSIDAFLQEDLDVVHILLPGDQHVEAARRVLQAGKHAFVEKPMGLGEAECRELAALAARLGLRLGVNHNFLFLRAFEQLRADLARGALGRLDHLAIRWLYPFEPLHAGPFDHWALRAPRNLAFEVGPHLVAFALQLVGPLHGLQTSVSRPIELPNGARAWRHWHARGTRGETAVELTLSLAAGPAERSLLVRGSGGLARCDVERDLYSRETPGAGPLQLEHFLGAVGMAWRCATGAGRNLFSLADPFKDSIARSVARFYETLDREPDARHDPLFGAEVTGACERIAAAAADPQPRAAPRAAPPVRKPSVLVLGGSGFIGRHLVRALAARGAGVRVATRNAAAAGIALAGLPAELAEGDLADAHFIDGALEGIEVVYDLTKADVAVTRNVAERALAKGVRRFIHTGSIDAHYSAKRGEVITSETPLDPKIARRNAYARAKAACEALLGELHRDRGLPLVVFRPGIVIGSGAPPAHWGVGRFCSENRVQFWGDGGHPLPLVLVEDVAEALALALDKPGIDGETFLVTGEPLLSGRDYVAALAAERRAPLHAEPTPIWKFWLAELAKEAVKHLVRHPNRRMPSYRDWDSRSHRARYDDSKTRVLLGWQPAATREALIARGVAPSVREYMR